MKIIIKATDEGKVTSFDIKDGKCQLDALMAIFFEIMDSATKKVLADAPDEVVDYTYDHFNALFELFLRNVFPEPPEGYFELSDAALLYAQDKIVEEADKRGITFEEALEKFESRAKEYVRQKKEGLS